MRLVANIISIVFHPVFIPLYAAYITMAANPSVFNYLENPIRHLLLILFVNTVLMPGVIILMMKPLGFLKSIKMEERTDRILPFIAGLFFYIWTVVLFFRQQLAPDIINILLLGCLIALIIAFLTNLLFLKVSIHTAAMGLLVAMVITAIPLSEKNLIPVLVITLLAAGSVGTSRLVLKAHTQKEIYTGYLLGAFSLFLAVNIIL